MALDPLPDRSSNLIWLIMLVNTPPSSSLTQDLTGNQYITGKEASKESFFRSHLLDLFNRLTWLLKVPTKLCISLMTTTRWVLIRTAMFKQLLSLLKSMESLSLSPYAQLSKIWRGQRMIRASSRMLLKLRPQLCSQTLIWHYWSQTSLLDQSLTSFTILRNVLSLVNPHIQTLSQRTTNTNSPLSTPVISLMQLDQL